MNALRNHGTLIIDGNHAIHISCDSRFLVSRRLPTVNVVAAPE
jgi:hypothetical protein